MLSFGLRSCWRRRWIEHDPKDLLSSVQECIKIAVEKFVKAGNNVADIKGIISLFFSLFIYRKDAIRSGKT